jgi:hypothetical protein
MEKFFKNKTIHKDGKDQPIPDEMLYTDKNLSILTQCFDYNWGMGLLEEQLKGYLASGKQLHIHPINNKDDEIALNMFFIQEFKTHAVVKDFQAGTALLYMLLCEGMNFKEYTKDSNEKKKSNNEGRSRRATPISAG